jgi:dihydropteroate synthase
MGRPKTNSEKVIVTPITINSETDAYRIMISLGVSPAGARIMAPKSVYSVFKIEGIKSWEANIIKQHLLSLGSDAAVERAALVKDIETAILIFASRNQLIQLCKKLNTQPFSLKEVSKKINAYLKNGRRQDLFWRAGNKKIKLHKPVVCGILNITDDSFSGDGFLNSSKDFSSSLIKRVLKVAGIMLKEGATILDVGGESTRPFAKPITAAAEIKRVVPVIKALRKEFRKVPLSVDTYKVPVAKAAADEGVDIINDIRGLNFSPKMSALIAANGLGCVLMHMKGTPQTMQVKPVYQDVVSQVSNFFKERLQYCEKQKIGKEQICLDPGIGFGKRLQDNNRLIRSLEIFTGFGRPIFLGLSRKSFIGTIIDKDIGGRLSGSLAASVIAVINGANILRVHDVAATVEALKVAEAIRNS